MGNYFDFFFFLLHYDDFNSKFPSDFVLPATWHVETFPDCQSMWWGASLFPSRVCRRATPPERVSLSLSILLSLLWKNSLYFIFFYVNPLPRIQRPVWAAAHTVLITISNQQHSDVYIAVSCFGHIRQGFIFSDLHTQDNMMLWLFDFFILKLTLFLFSNIISQCAKSFDEHRSCLSGLTQSRRTNPFPFYCKRRKTGMCRV